jgi:hypothetical protein
VRGAPLREENVVAHGPSRESCSCSAALHIAVLDGADLQWTCSGPVVGR